MSNTHLFGTLWIIKHHLLVPFFGFGFSGVVDTCRIIGLVNTMEWFVLYIYLRGYMMAEHNHIKTAIMEQIMNQKAKNK